MKIFTGQVVRGENFFPREKEIEDIWYHIKNSSHILLIAPRRVGKTSIMYNILDNKQDDYIVLYLNTEDANSIREFWKKLYYKLLHDDELHTYLKQKAAKLYNFIKSIDIKEVTAKGVKFGDGKELDYVEAFKKLVKNLDNHKKLIIMIDEFAQTIENIAKYESEKDAVNLLQIHRAIRLDTLVSKNVTFIYAGSIGLESVTSRLDSSKHINDLVPVKVTPLEYEEAIKFVKELAESNGIDISETERKYLLEKIEWFIPFYIQLIMEQLRQVKSTITVSNIDKAFTDILDNRNHFEHWHSRLKSMGDAEYKFARELLNEISIHSTQSKAQIVNLVTKYGLEEDIANEIVHTLIYDGYIHKEAKEYRFNSPILKKWWEENVAN